MINLAPLLGSGFRASVPILLLVLLLVLEGVDLGRLSLAIGAGIGTQRLAIAHCIDRMASVVRRPFRVVCVVYAGDCEPASRLSSHWAASGSEIDWIGFGQALR